MMTTPNVSTSRSLVLQSNIATHVTPVVVLRGRFINKNFASIKRPTFNFQLTQ